MTLSCKDLCASYGSHQVLNNISLTLNKGDFICLCGKNGSGKSTLLKLFSGTYPLNKRALHITGGSISPVFKDPRLASQKISYLPQSETPAWNCNVLDCILQGRFSRTEGIYTLQDKDIACKMADAIGIGHLLDRTIFSLSGGEFQKVRIARSLTQEPEFLLLDEPCASLDFTAQNELFLTLKELCKSTNTGVLMSIHDINAAARYADILGLLPVNKPLLLGSVSQIFTAQNLNATFDCKIKIFNHPVLNCPQIY